MATRKNVIFIGMTQNGKSSLVKQILHYGSESEQASTVSIGRSNISETQKCSRYNVDLPLKSHHLRQTEGPDKDRNGQLIVPGVDFEIDEAHDYAFSEEVEDSGERLQLSLIDTPGLSDSGNNPSSTSGMKTVDEQHKLRILLTLQETENVHAICFVVRRDTAYGGDFQTLVRRMIDLLSFCNRSTAWNLQYRIIHTNITPDDYAEELCAERQHAFDKFGPAGAEHHFLDNEPDCESQLETFLTNRAFSDLFRSLAASAPVKFSDLHYPKSSEHQRNDQVLIDTIQRAISELETMIEEWAAIIARLEDEVSRHVSVVNSSQKRIDKCNDRINELDQDCDSMIDGQEGSTGFHVFGGVNRFFHFRSDIPITKVDLWHDGRGYWKNVEQTQHTYRAELEPYWWNQAYGKVTMFVTKRNKHAAEISQKRAEREPYVARRDEFQPKIVEAKGKISSEEDNARSARAKIDALKRDLVTVQNSGRSFSLKQMKDLILFFTVDSPLAAATGYELRATVPWMVPSLKKLPISSLQSEARMLNEETRNATHATVCDLKAAQVAFDCLSSPDGLPIGVFTSIHSAYERGEDGLFNVFISELKVVSEMAERVLHG